MKMIVSDEPKYLEWLNTIANSRLLFNTIGELEDYLDNHNIHTNGIKRCYNTKQKARAAFADLCLYVAETAKMTSNDFCILLDYYKKTSEFYQKRLSRRKNPDDIIKTILDNYFLNPERRNCSPSMNSIIQESIDNDIDIPILVLLLVRAWGGYKSKDGDIVDLWERYKHTIDLLEDYSEEIGCQMPFPPIVSARNEEYKSRLTLAYHVREIIEKARQFSDPDRIFRSVHNARNLDMDIEGYWNECGGKAERTDFWQIEKTTDTGLYYAIKFNKIEGGKVERTRYSVDFSEDDFGRVTAMFMHPKAGRHYFDDDDYDESDHCYYKMDMPDDVSNVTELDMIEALNYHGWPKRVVLTKVTEKSIIEYYDKTLNNSQIINKFKKLETEFTKSLYAITDKHLYIKAMEDGKLYKVPTDIIDSLRLVDMDSRIGLLKVGNTEFIALDDFNVFIPVKDIKECGIEVVDRIG